MTAAIPSKSLSWAEIPSFFGADIDSFKKITDLGRSVITALGYIVASSGAFLKPLGDSLKMASSYFAGTRLIGSIADWVPNEKGDVRATKTLGNSWFRGISSAAFVAIDFLEAMKFLEMLKLIDLAKISESMGRIPIIGPIFQSSFNPLKAVVGFIGAGATVIDTGFAIKNTLAKMGTKGVTFDFISGITFRGWFKSAEDNLETQKAKIQAGKDFRDITTNLLKTMLKTTLVALSLFGIVLHPVVAFIGLSYSLISFARILIKGYDKKPSENDPQFAKAWNLAKDLPVRA